MSSSKRWTRTPSSRARPTTATTSSVRPVAPVAQNAIGAVARQCTEVRVMNGSAPVYVKHLADDRVVEVIGRHVCIEGRPETDHLVVIDEHPNRLAILLAVPGATHVAGRVPLTMPQASMAQAALRRAHDT